MTSQLKALLTLDSEVTSRSPEADDALAGLIALAEHNKNWPEHDSWMPTLERDVARLILKLIDNASLPEDGLSPQLLHVSELRGIYPAGDEKLEFWRTRRLSFSGHHRDDRQRSMTESAVEHDQDDGLGWYIRPQDEKGKRLGYRLLFDSDQRETDLAWEKHGEGKSEWGNPKKDVWSKSEAKRRYKACWKAVTKKGLFEGPFDTWAPRFIKPSSKAYVAYSEEAGPRNVPAAPMLWAELADQDK